MSAVKKNNKQGAEIENYSEECPLCWVVREGLYKEIKT